MIRCLACDREAKPGRRYCRLCLKKLAKGYDLDGKPPTSREIRRVQVPGRTYAFNQPSRKVLP